jgi:hypothetical protein
LPSAAIQHARKHARRVASLIGPCVLAVAMAILAPTSSSHAAQAPQEQIRITGDRLSGFVLPVEAQVGDIRISGLRAWAWDVDDTRRLLLEGDVAITIGNYQLQSQRALVWINRIPSADGLINQIAAYFERIDDPTKQAGLGVVGRDVLVTGSARGSVELKTSLLTPQRPEGSAFIRAGEQRLEMHLRQLAAGEHVRLQDRPQADEVLPPPPPVMVPGGSPPQTTPDLPERIELPAQETGELPIFEPGGRLSLSFAGQLDFTPGDQESILTVLGPMVAEYVTDSPSHQWSQITLSAQNAVLFADPELVDTSQTSFDVSRLRGLYLEGNVIATANSGEYTVRAPRIYYDFKRNQAVMVHAVLRTYDDRIGLPLYARAAELRQVAANQWTGTGARVSTSEFFTPHLAIGAERITVTQPPGDTRAESMHIDSRDNTLRVSGVPIAYWPRFSGSIEDIPLRSIEIGNSSSEGIGIETRWDLLTLLGRERPRGVDAELAVDGFTKRGPAAGIDFHYDFSDVIGAVNLYGLYDQGVDRTSSGRDVEPAEEVRGYALFEHSATFARDWLTQIQFSKISDPTFMTTWRDEWFEERREFESSFYLKWQRDTAAATGLVKYAFNDFISNDWLLASRAMTVDRVPEFSYRRYGDALWDAIVYSGETRLTRMRFRFDRDTTEELGVRDGAFGLPPDEQISDALRAQGLPEDYVSRLDSRHELSYPFSWQAVKLAPFVVGRFTGYDDDFQDFSSDADEYRVFGSAGVRLSTEFHRVDNSVESRLFDLHRMRHIIEPRAMLWYGYSTVPDGALPPYDIEVESIGDAAAVMIGLRNTWQTQRGGPGRWRSVDFLTIDVAAALNSNDAQRESPTPQFFEYRPEYSQFGDHIAASATWLISDSLSIVGETTYDLDESDFARGSIGGELRHNPAFSTYAEYRFIDASETELLGVAWNYQVSPKYAVRLSPQWDLREDEFRRFRVRLTRTFPDFALEFEVDYDVIRDETIIGASLNRAEF